MIPSTIVGRALSPVSGASVATFRAVFGIVALVAIIRMFAHGWIDALYVEPAHHFTYPGFGWVRPLPDWGMYLLFAVIGALSVCIAIGYRYRLSVALFFLGFTYAELIDRTTYLNHHYWMSLLALLMVFLPLNQNVGSGCVAQSFLTQGHSSILGGMGASCSSRRGLCLRRNREAEPGLAAACPTVANLALPARRLCRL